MSEETTKKPPGIYAALASVKRKIGAVGKSQHNQQQNYNYRGIDDIYNAVSPLFSEYGIISIPEMIEHKRESHTSAKGTLSHFSIVTMRYKFFHEDGSSVDCTVVGEGMDSGDKATNKAMAAAHKYAICQILTIPYQLTDSESGDSQIVTERMLSELKTLWRKQVNQKKGQNSQTLQTDFALWAYGVLKVHFDYLDHEQWNMEFYKKCVSEASKPVDII